MQNLLYRASKWKYIIPIFIVFVVFIVGVFPLYQSQLSGFKGSTFIPLDMRFSYTSSDVREEFQKLGGRGRELYSTLAGRVDMAFPVFYGALFLMAISYFVRRIYPQGSGWVYLSLIPLVGVVLDYLENILILRLLHSFPKINDVHVQEAEQMTRAKHGVLILSLGIILVFASSWFFKRRKLRKV